MSQHLVDITLDRLVSWRASTMPRNEWLIAKEGDIYVRWTPGLREFGIEARFTVASIQLTGMNQGKGVYSRLMEELCSTTVPVIYIESILNERLLSFAKRAVYPNRETVVSERVLSPSVSYVIRK